MVAEGAVVGVFEDPHDLDRVIACGGDAGEDAEFEFLPCADLGGFLGHADVAFVDEGRAIGGEGSRVLPEERRGFPDLSGEDEG